MITIPTIEEIYNSYVAALETELNITIPTQGKSFLRALAAVQASQLKMYYLATGKVQKNIFADTADPEAQGGTLERFGVVKLNRYPFQATEGEYILNVTGTAGGIIPNGTIFKSDDDGSLNPGKLYILDNGHTMVASSDQITVRALETGLDSQLQAGDTLTVTAPVAAIDSTADVYAELTEPVAAEDLEEYREKILEAFRLEPQGGAGADYRIWAADAQGVAQSYPYAVAGNSNQINLYIEATEVDSTDGKGTPTTAILDAVESAIEDPTVDRPARKPLGVFLVNYLAITPLDVDIEIPSFVDLTTNKQTLIEAALATMADGVRPFIDSIDVTADKNDIISENTIVSEILSAVPGATFGSIVLKVNGSTVTSYTFDNGEIPYLNSVSFT